MNIKEKSFVDVENEPLHKEEYQNDLIRIYRAILEPGKSTEFHKHSKNTIYLIFKGGKISTQLMKGTPSCPSIVSRALPIRKKLKLLFQKNISKYLDLEKGFIFYMPSKKYPVIHRAISSNSNHGRMDLLGIEILFSNNGRSTVSNSYGRKEIESKEIIISRLYFKPGQVLSDLSVEEPSLLLVISGEIEITNEQKLVSLSAGMYYWVVAKSLQSIRNKDSQDAEIILICMKNK